MIRSVIALAVLLAVACSAFAQYDPRVDELNRRLTVVEKTLTDAGRTLLFRNEVKGTAENFPRPMPGPPAPGAPRPKPVAVASSPAYARVTYTRTFGSAVAAARSTDYHGFAPVRRTLLTLGSLGTVPGGQRLAR